MPLVCDFSILYPSYLKDKIGKVEVLKGVIFEKRKLAVEGISPTWDKKSLITITEAGEKNVVYGILYRISKGQLNLLDMVMEEHIRVTMRDIVEVKDGNDCIWHAYAYIPFHDPKESGCLDPKYKRYHMLFVQEAFDLFSRSYQKHHAKRWIDPFET